MRVPSHHQDVERRDDLAMTPMIDVVFLLLIFFVCASLGQTKKGSTDNGGKILNAMLAVDGKSGKYPEFKGNVAAVYTHPLSKGSSSGGHYGGNAETYMNVGEAMGRAMAELLENKN